MNRKIKKIISYILSFLLILSLILSLFVNIFKTTILSEDYMLSKLLESNYYGDVEHTIQSEFEGYIQQSGFDNSILDNVVNEKNITSDVNTIVRNIYQNTNYAINTSTIEETLNKNIDNYIVSHDFTIDVKQKENISIFINKLQDTYIKDIFPKDAINPMTRGMIVIKGLLSRIAAFIYVLPFVFILLILLINLNMILSSFKYICLAILSSGLFLCAIYLILINNIQIGKIQIFTTGISDLVRVIFRNIMIEINAFCGIFIIIGLIFTFIFILIENRFEIETKENRKKGIDKWIFR